MRQKSGGHALQRGSQRQILGRHAPPCLNGSTAHDAPRPRSTVSDTASRRTTAASRPSRSLAPVFNHDTQIYGFCPVVKVVLWSRGAHLTKPGWSKPHTHSNPTNLALFGHKITLFNQGGLILLQGGSNGSRGLSPPPDPLPPHFNHWFCRPQETQALMDRMSACISDVAGWMMSNRSQLNTAKTEALWCASSRQQHLIPSAPLRVCADHSCKKKVFLRFLFRARFFYFFKVFYFADVFF